MPTIPSSTTILVNMAATANPFFQDLLPFVYFMGGLLFAVLLVKLIIWGVEKLSGHF